MRAAEQPGHQSSGMRRRCGNAGETGADFRPLEPMLVELRGQLHEVVCTLVPEIIGKGDVGHSACSAWPNSWNKVRASSKLSMVGWLSPAL